MPPQSRRIKKIIIILGVLVVVVGAYFGVKFYQASKLKDGTIEVTDPKTGKTYLQTRVSTSTQNDPQIGFLTPDAPTVNNTPNNTQPNKQRLFQLWKQPVSGFDFVYKDIEITATSTVNKPTPVFVTTSPSATTSTSTATGTRVFSVDEKKTPEASIETVVYKKTVIKNQEYAYLWDRTTGNIYENLSSTTDVTRLSNYTLPRMEEAVFIDPFSVLVRGIGADNESIVTKYLTLYKETATSTLYSANSKNISIPAKQVSVLADAKKMFYFTPKTGKGNIMNTDGTSQAMIINTSLTEWLYQYINKNTVAITTKPSAYFPGYAFFVSTNGSGSNEYIIGEKYGFTTLTSPDGSKMLYSEIIDDQLETFILTTKSKNFIRLSQSTLTEKCVWNNSSTLIYCGVPQRLANAPYPDAWYQNQTDFSDNIWSINPETGEFKVMVPLQDQIQQPIDVYSIKVSKTNKYLLFQDRYTLTLWKYEL